MLCFERSPASAGSAAAGASPALTAAMMRCCAGQMRNQTLNAIMVPNMAPVWMRTERGSKPPMVTNAQTETESSRNDTIAAARTLDFSPLFQRAS